jgi:DNA phosphorothioation-dependent restriction protein DptG
MVKDTTCPLCEGTGLVRQFGWPQAYVISIKNWKEENAKTRPCMFCQGEKLVSQEWVTAFELTLSPVDRVPFSLYEVLELHTDLVFQDTEF